MSSASPPGVLEVFILEVSLGKCLARMMEVPNVTRGGAVPNLEDAQTRGSPLVEHRHRLGSCPRDLPEDQILSVNNDFEVAVMN